ncbi:MAG: hypothetical protein AB7F86_06955 [Bdellovibrionales bacterium]
MSRLRIHAISAALSVVLGLSSAAWAAQKGVWPVPKNQSPICEAELLEGIGSRWYLEAPYYNAGLLLWLFGSQKNKMAEWLKSLETGVRAEGDPALYFGSGGAMIMKPIEYPYDMGQTIMTDTDKKQYLGLLRFSPGEIETMRGSSPEAKRARDLLLARLDRHFFGAYGIKGALDHEAFDARDVTWHAGLTVAVYPRVAHEIMRDWVAQDRSEEEPSEVLAEVQKVAEIVAQNEQTTLLKIDLGRKPENRTQEILQQMFFITHWQMTQLAYRQSGLFPNKMETALYLVDDFARAMKERGQSQKLYLLYENGAFKVLSKRLAMANRFVRVYEDRAGWQNFQYQRISDAFFPLYPSYGAVVDQISPGKFEIKRLFNNANPNPLDINVGWQEIGKIEPTAFYRLLADDLPDNCELEVVSKSKVHNRYYARVGFKLVHEEFYEPWDAIKYTLAVSCQEFRRLLQQRR